MLISPLVSNLDSAFEGYAKGRKGVKLEWGGLQHSYPCSNRIRKTLPLIPSHKPNTTCSRNLKISGLIAVSKRLTYVPIGVCISHESCQSEILFESQVTRFLCCRQEPRALTLWVIQSPQQRTLCSL